MNTKYRMMLAISIMAVLFLAPGRGWTMEKVDNYTVGEVVKIKSNILGEERIVFVSLPEGYASNLERYPVLYLLGGFKTFPVGSGLSQFLAGAGRVPHMIVVGVTNPESFKNLTPTGVKRFPKSGGAEKFLEFLGKELIPGIDKTYRTQPFRLLYGHAIGGLFAAYVLLNAPEAFNAYITSSPWLVWDNRRLLKNSGVRLDQYPSLNRFFYFSSANEPDLPKLAGELDKILTGKSPKGLRWKYEYMENEDHATVVFQSLNNGIRWVFSDWMLPLGIQRQGIDAVKAHYKKLSELYGYTVQAPAHILNSLGFQLLNRKKVDEAIPFFEYCVKLYPGAWMAYHNLGYCYQQAGDTQKAIANYEQSLKINPGNETAAQRLKALKGE